MYYINKEVTKMLLKYVYYKNVKDEIRTLDWRPVYLKPIFGQISMDAEQNSYICIDKNDLLK